MGFLFSETWQWLLCGKPNAAWFFKCLCVTVLLCVSTMAWDSGCSSFLGQAYRSLLSQESLQPFHSWAHLAKLAVFPASMDQVPRSSSITTASISGDSGSLERDQFTSNMRSCLSPCWHCKSHPLLRLDWDVFPSSCHWRVMQIFQSLVLLPWVAHVCQEWLLEAAASPATGSDLAWPNVWPAVYLWIAPLHWIVKLMPFALDVMNIPSPHYELDFPNTERTLCAGHSSVLLFFFFKIFVPFIYGSDRQQ